MSFCLPVAGDRRGRCRVIPLASLMALLIAACGERGALDRLPRGETGRVVRVIDGDAIVLDTGQSVRLVGIEAPQPGRRGAPGEPHAARSARMLEDMAMGRTVRLFYPGLTRDRYDRALAHVRTEDGLGPKIWLNLEMARRGGARVRIYPDTSLLGESLLAAEQEARAADSGLWSDPVYRVLAPAETAEADRRFVLVRLDAAIVRPPDNAERHACSLVAPGVAFTVDVAHAARAACEARPGSAIVRGYLRTGRLELTDRLNIEPVIPS